MRYAASISEALYAYALEGRETREMKRLGSATRGRPERNARDFPFGLPLKRFLGKNRLDIAANLNGDGPCYASFLS